MNKSSSPLLSQFLSITQPLWLVSGLVFYSLGGALTVYLGGVINWPVYWLGQAAVTMLQVSAALLNAYYEIPDPVTNPQAARRAREAGRNDPPRTAVLQAAATTLTIGAVLTVLLFNNKAMNLSVFLVLGLAFVLAFFYAVPPTRLVSRGYGELIESFITAALFPTLAYLFQTGEMHRMLTMLTFPLVALYLAMKLATSLEGYGDDLKQGRKTLMVRLGWQNGMVLHNILVLGAYVMIGVASLLGLPWVITWPALLSLPVGGLQILQMNQIAGGAKPAWRQLNLTAAATVALTVYLIIFTLWTR